ncbi:MAG: translation initiation factor eIF-6, partial [Methanomassiliicoccaceae archaeon]|nr:translation initiation factor eIF-6 [Methanomassiliicoccaceae archaeon]
PAARRVADALGVEVVRSAIAGCGVVGSVCAATNKGCVCCAGATEEDMALLRDVLGVEARKASVNHGSPQVGAGMLCNSKGALVGDETTPVEMGRIEDGLALY